MITKVGFGAGFKVVGFKALGFSFLDFFKDGQQGVLYEVWDTSTLFQDVEMTIPVTADGDPVRVMLDKSGNGNHAVAPSSAARPTYRTDGILHKLSFDAVDDYLQSALFNTVISQPLSIILATNQERVAGSYGFQLDSSAPNRFSFLHTDTGETEVTAGASVTSNLIEYDTPNVYSFRLDGANSTMQRNNSDAIVGNLGGNGIGDIIIGKYVITDGFFGKIDFYGMLIVGDIASVDVENAKALFANKAGVTL